MDIHTFTLSLEKFLTMPPLSVVLGIMALLWFTTFRSLGRAYDKSLAQHKISLELQQKTLEQYRTDLASQNALHLQAATDMRNMFDKNSKLVEQSVVQGERYAHRSEHLERLIQTNIQSWQVTLKAIEDNQFCPRVKELGGKT